MLSKNLHLSVLAATLLFAGVPVRAETKSPWEVSANAFYGGQGDSDLDKGGKVGLTFGGLGIGFEYAPSDKWSVGLDLSVSRFRFDFSGTGPIASLEPWSNVTAVELAIPFSYSFDDRWSVYGQAIAERFGTSDADSGESDIFGGFAAVIYSFAPNRRLGLGAGVFNGLEQTEGYPLLLVDWQFDENWRLANPLQAGPAGGPGLELIRNLGSGWEASIGGVFRDLRFRLDKNLAAAPGGIGEYSAALAFLRVGYKFQDGLSLDFYAGADFGGEIKLLDAKGNDLRTDDLSTAPLLSLSLTGKF